jgi:hypothetical protein
MNLRNVLYISYLLPEARVRPVVPANLPLDTWDSVGVFVSIVSMSCRSVRLSYLPWPVFNYNQLNLRTYVVDPSTGNRAVYFLQSGVTSAATSYSTKAIGISWQHISYDLNVYCENENDHEMYIAAGNWNGEIRINASVLWPGERDDRQDNLEAIEKHITTPLVGFIGPPGRVRRFEIRHHSLEVLSGWLKDIDLPLVLSNGLLGKEEMLKPHNVLYVPEAEFRVLLPPGRIRPGK